MPQVRVAFSEADQAAVAAVAVERCLQPSQLYMILFNLIVKSHDRATAIEFMRAGVSMVEGAEHTVVELQPPRNVEN